MNQVQAKRVSREDREEWKSRLSQGILKQASPIRPSDKETEAAFLDQAYSYIESKAGVLMQDPYRMGFEVVWSNDGRSKMLGIFAFRLGSELYYAPVMFLNSRIKAPGLLYKVSVRQIRPLTPEWARYLVSKTRFNSNEAIERGNNSPDGLRLQNIAQGAVLGAGSLKYASVLEEPDALALMSDDQADRQIDQTFGGDGPDDLDNQDIQDFLETHKEARFSYKIASAMLQNRDFAEAVISFVGEPSEWYAKGMPDPKPPKLAFRQLDDQIAKYASDEQKALLIKNGFAIEDNRAEEDLSTILDNDNAYLEDATVPGLYMLLQADGSLKEAAVFPMAVPPEDLDRPFHTSSRRKDKQMLLLSPSSDAYQMPDGDEFPRGQLKETFPEDAENRFATSGENLKPGHVYGRLSKGKINAVLFIDSRNALEDGLVLYSYLNVDDYELRNGCFSCYGKERQMVFNPDYQVRGYDLGVCSKDDGFVEIPRESLTDHKGSGSLRVSSGSGSNSAYEGFRWNGKLGELCDTTTHAIDRFVFGHGHAVKLACVAKEGEFQIEVNGKTGEYPLHRRKALFNLVKYAALTQDVAGALLDTAAKVGRVELLLQPPATIRGDREKVASSYGSAFVDPVWGKGRNDVTNIEEDYPQAVISPISKTLPAFPRARYGDGFQHRQRNQNTEDEEFASPYEWQNSSPEELAQLAELKQWPSVFKHGLLSSLASEQDAGVEFDISQELPSAYKWMDSLGRMIFRFHWNPKSFEEIYGSDDMTELENNLTGAWNVTGKLVLSLQRKSDSYSTAGSEVNE